MLLLVILRYGNIFFDALYHVDEGEKVAVLQPTVNAKQLQELFYKYVVFAADYLSGLPIETQDFLKDFF